MLSIILLYDTYMTALIVCVIPYFTLLIYTLKYISLKAKVIKKAIKIISYYMYKTYIQLKFILYILMIIILYTIIYNIILYITFTIVYYFGAPNYNS